MAIFTNTMYRASTSVKKILSKVFKGILSWVRSSHVTDDVIPMKVIKMYLTYKYLPRGNLLFPYI